MRWLLVIFVLCCAHSMIDAQIKTSGIKTHYRSDSSGNLVVNNTEQFHRVPLNVEYINGNNRQFIPADTYQGQWNQNGNIQDLRQGEVSQYGGGSSHYIQGEQHNFGMNVVSMTRQPVILDATAEFINKTRSAMASGVCYKEVPTSSLVKDSNTPIVGNGTTPNMSKIQICCEGYERNPHVYARCDPICKDDCPNGICTAPNTCVCIPGHVRDFQGKCISTCPLGCGNGICDERGECQCRPGYKIEPQQRKFCVPHCEQNCGFGSCVAPNKCDCLDGYRKAADGTCEPKCDSCDNGKCTAPGICVCHKGYEKVNNVCEPICTLGCTKGRCVRPDVCECLPGFELDRTGANCVPHCEQPCINGVCDGANSCACNPGYIADEIRKNVCQPHCPQGCPNGFCTSPNFCLCNPNFKKSGIKGRQVCVPV